MAALAESGLRNLNMKGNPFAGFFSMHRSLSKGCLPRLPAQPGACNCSGSSTPR